MFILIRWISGLWFLILFGILIQEAYHLSIIKIIVTIVSTLLFAGLLYFLFVYSIALYANPFIG